MSTAAKYAPEDNVGEAQEDSGPKEQVSRKMSAGMKKQRSVGFANRKRRLQKQNDEDEKDLQDAKDLSRLRKDSSGRNSLGAQEPQERVGETPWSMDEEEAKLTLAERTWILFEDPTSSPLANFIAFFLIFLIALSCGAFVIETLPMFYQKYPELWNGIETVCIIFFTIEYCIRIVVCPNKIEFLTGFLNTVDLVAIVPFYIEAVEKSVNPSHQQGGGSTAVFRVLRLIRVFRVFKISRYLKWVKVLAVAMMESASPLAMVLFIIMIATIFFSSAIYFVEAGTWDPKAGAWLTADGHRSAFQSIPQSMYWCLITMTTVGYGDVYPVTSEGKFIGAITSLSGIFVLAIPITIISTNFNQEYYKMKKNKASMRARMKLLQRHFQTQKTGLAAMNDEIEEIINRTGKEFQKQFEEVLDETNKNLLQEVGMIVKLAYDAQEKRNRDAEKHLAESDDHVQQSAAKKSQVAPA